MHEDTSCSATDVNDWMGRIQEKCTYLVQVEVRDGLDEHGNKEEGDPADDAAAELRVDDEDHG